MKTMFKSVSMLAVAACAGMSVVSCTADKDLYNPEVAEQNIKAEYEANFIKKFGSVAGINWDLSEEDVMTSFAEMNTRGFTKQQGIKYIDYSNNVDNNFPYLTDGYFYVPASMQSNMITLKEDNNNSKFGNTWAMATPGNEFSIVPIRQGQSSEGIELHMVVGRGNNATDYTVWKKGKFIQKSPKGENKWSDVGTSFDNGHTNSVSKTNLKEVDVRTKAYTFTNLPQDEPIYFYLYRPTSGEYPSSLEGYLKDQSKYVGVPEEITKDGKEVKILGFEARWNKQVTDWDYEDLVFMIVGNPNVPEDIDPEGETFKQSIAKRYMIEDLGKSDDTDFNDIVVDVEKYRYMTVELDPTNGQVKNRTFTDWAEKATLRHLGGTLQFNVKIGDTELGLMEGQMGVNPDEEYPINGWDPERNNISIKVMQKDGEVEGSYTIEFPETGSVPLMVATKTREDWSAERVSFLDKIKEILASIIK